MGIKFLLRTSLLAGLLALSGIASAADLVLAANGKSDYQIVVPDASPSPEIGQWLEQTARLIQDAFQANGCKLSIAPEGKRDPAKPGIYLGDTALARAHGVTVQAFPDWRYVHKVAGRDVILAGRDQPCPIPQAAKRKPIAWSGLPRLGTLKAATDFLRQYAGTRFLYPGETGIEFLPTPVIAVPAELNVLQVPPVQFNFMYWGQNGFYEMANNFFPSVDTNIGGHTWPEAIPADTYRETHPEYFALLAGKRCCTSKDYRGKWTEQYCISNPEVRALIYQELLDKLQRGYETVGLGQPDGFQPCQCDSCKALYGTGDDWGEKIWILHRDLAARLQQERPGKKVIIISYGQTWSPPKSFHEFPDNVIVLLCRMTPEILKEWSECQVPGGFASYLYTFLGGYAPVTTPVAIEAQVKRLHAFHVRGAYQDSFFGNYGLMGPAIYVYGRLFDDPAGLRAKDLLQEFYDGAFREAAAPMRQFYDTLYHAVQFAVDFPPAYEDVTGRKRGHAEKDSMKRMTFLYSPDVLHELGSLLSQAEKLAASDKVKRRLALVRLEFDYVRHIATVGHLWNAYRMVPDPTLHERLLDAVDAWNAFLDPLFTSDNGRYMKYRIPGWPELVPFAGHSHYCVALTKDNLNYTGYYEQTPLNWNTAELRKAARSGEKP